MGKVLPDAGLGSGQNVPQPASFVEGASPSMRAVEAMIRELAHSNVPVLLLAERGTGKRATAERIHALSGRAGERFHSFVCAHAQPDALEKISGRNSSEFNGGTIYLDEIADLSQECQARLIKALPHEGNGTAVGSSARLICGSSRDLESEVRAGRFREDLYYRVSGVCLRLPPLRQRREDIPVLVEYFLSKYAREFRRTAPTLSAETLQLFHDYSWPGNLKELEDAVKALVALGDESIAMGGLRSLLRRSDNGGNGARVSLKQAARAASREAERELILRVLTRTRWNRRRAAQELQISYKALLYKLKQIGCEGYGAS
ncbi:MAG TPA: sigma 54-interacting transcriptional regulator [Candidatus Sulfotelmatobacter sp.]|nr:sigma 54-interacting transcriptional regulator [Candidatus Sulfotelmatobacter sp.]